jgi:hypothetical protein
LDFKRADVDAVVTHTPEIWAALIVERRWSKAWIACIDGWAALQQSVGPCWTAVVLQRAKQRIGIDLIPRGRLNNRRRRRY